jgi:hypothetical protein
MASKSLLWLALAMLMATVVITMAENFDAIATAAPEDPADVDDLPASSATKVRASNNSIAQ